MKVLLIDDHPLVLSALTDIIHKLDDRVQVLTADGMLDSFVLLHPHAQGRYTCWCVCLHTYILSWCWCRSRNGKGRKSQSRISSRGWNQTE